MHGMHEAQCTAVHRAPTKWLRKPLSPGPYWCATRVEVHLRARIITAAAAPPIAAAVPARRPPSSRPAGQQASARC
jgi:hypothetical protein